MGRKRALGIGLTAVGVIIVLLMLTADSIGLGSPEHGFGRMQKLGTLVGAAVTLVGIVLASKK